MSILAYYAQQNSFAGEVLAPTNQTASGNSAPASWEEQCIRILKELPAVESADGDSPLRQWIYDFVRQAQLGQQRNVEECLFVFGPQYVEIFAVNDTRNGN